MYTRAFTAAAIALLAGCASGPGGDELPADHPARPDAAVAPVPTPSTTLAVGPEQRVAPPEQAPAATQGGEHGHHGQGHGGGGTATAPAPTNPTDHGHHGADHGHHGAAPTTAPAASAPTGATAAVYSCPHHPEVTSDRPDARCPKCNMKLVKKQGTEPAGHQHGGHR